VVHAVAYGLRLRSNRSIPGLAASSPSEAVDVDIHLGDRLDGLVDPEACIEHYVSPVRSRGGRPIVIVKRDPTGAYLWLYDDGPRFLIDPSGHRIWADGPDTAGIDEAALSLLGPILGFVLRLHGITCLHASAVAVDGRAIALVGPQFAGKSTTAAALVARGHALVSEDVVPLIDRGTYYEVVPGYPAIRLWPKSIAMLYGSGVLLPLLTSRRDKRRLDLDYLGQSFHRDPLPLAAIYSLNWRSHDDRAPMVESVPSHQALVMLVGDAYNNYALTTDMRAREFNLLGRLTQAVPLRSVTPHADPRRLPQLCTAILNDFAGRSGGPAPPENVPANGLVARHH
jgi:hypothetical protein